MSRAELDRLSHRALLWGYGVWISGVIAFFVPAATWSPVSRFALTRAIVEKRVLTIDADAAATGDRSRVGSHWYTDKAPLPSVLAVPAYTVIRTWNSVHKVAPRFTAIATPELPAKRVTVNRAFQRALYVCSLTTAGVAGTVLSLAVFALVRRRAPSAAALLSSELVTLGTPILPYSTSFYGHVLAGACLVVSVLLLDGQSVSAPPPRRVLWLAGACLGCAPGAEYLTGAPAVLILFWFVSGVHRSARSRVVKGLFMGALPPLLMLGAYHAACFGAPWRTGYSFIARPEFAAGHARGLLGVRFPSWEAMWGLFFGVRRGLLYVAPVTALGLGGLVLSAVRERDPAARVGLATVIVLTWLNASYYMWWGGAAAGPRHLVPVLGFLALGVARVWRYGWLRPFIVALGAVSIANALVITAVGLEAPEYNDVLRRYAWPAFLHGHVARLSGASSLGLLLGLRSLFSLLPLGLWLVGGQIYVLYLLRADTAAPGTEREPHESGQRL